MCFSLPWLPACAEPVTRSWRQEELGEENSFGVPGVIHGASSVLRGTAGSSEADGHRGRGSHPKTPQGCTPRAAAVPRGLHWDCPVTGIAVPEHQGLPAPRGTGTAGDWTARAARDCRGTVHVPGSWPCAACAHSCSAVLSILPALKHRGQVLPATIDVPPLESNKMKISLMKGEAAGLLEMW